MELWTGGLRASGDVGGLAAVGLLAVCGVSDMRPGGREWASGC
jgi:hypothetical protein